ncbi:MAG TPA: FxsA family protein [Solirubrobacteraceae bacterium]|nr:FxsA family protein [Solirubrobacteraceae bacterium]
MLPVLLVLFIVVPIAELAVIIQVGQALGLLPTIALLVFDSVVGAVLVRAQGRAAWRQFADAVRAGRPPAREVLDGALVLLGGALLLTPGFLTDLLGLSLLLPPTRAVARRILARRLLRRMTASLAGAAARSPRTGPQPHDVEGTAVDADLPHLPPR